MPRHGGAHAEGPTRTGSHRGPDAERPQVALGRSLRLLGALPCGSLYETATLTRQLDVRHLMGEQPEAVHSLRLGASPFRGTGIMNPAEGGVKGARWSTSRWSGSRSWWARRSTPSRPNWAA